MAFRPVRKEHQNYRDIVGDYVKRFGYTAYDQNEDNDAESTSVSQEQDKWVFCFGLFFLCLFGKSFIFWIWILYSLV